MDQENIMFFKNDDKSCTMVGLYLNNTLIQYMILMLINYHYLKKVIINILLDIMM